MINAFLEAARRDEPVFISDVRAAFMREGTRPFTLRVTLYDGSARRFPLRLPEANTPEEAAFLASYVYATVYNVLSSLGALRIDVYTDCSDAALSALARSLPDVFQSSLPKRARTGYGKSLNVNERTIATLLPGQAFAFSVFPVGDEPASKAPAPAYGAPVFASLPARTAGKMLLGMDVGGTDVKLVVSVDGRLAAFKEFDWFPAGLQTAEELIEPLLLLTRLLRAAGSLCAAGMDEQVDFSALDKRATPSDMARAAADMERAAGDRLLNFDAIGLCFPDVVIQNRIVGGETYKTRGMRENTALDYEEQFAKISCLNDRLMPFVVPGGAVMSTNDGPMAAFTAAVEQAAAGADVSRGFFAHTLGTELGTGWVKPDGSIPQIPLEVYNCIIDLGSFPQRAFAADDARSVNNFNTLLAGTLQKYTSQSGVFRLAAKHLPSADAPLWREALRRGLFVREGGRLTVPTAPRDMRKAALEFFMERAASGEHPACAEIFRQIGAYLAVTYEETQFLLHPEAEARTLFGRLVKSPVCFALMDEGARARVPSLVQFAADDGLANTALMRQLAAHPDYTVAQFAQAVGAVYYACLAPAGNEA